MYTTLLSHPAAGPRLSRFLVFALSALFLLSGAAAQAQTALYGLGTLTRSVSAGNPFFPPGGNMGDQGLATFDPSSGSPVAFPLRILGLRSDERLVGIAFRPSTGQLYGLARTTTDEVALYTVNTYPNGTSGPAQYDTQAIPVSPPNSARIALALGGPTERVSFSFNPVADLIRVVSTNNANYRLSPTDGSVVTTGGADGPLAYAAGDPRAGTDPRIQTVAYTNAVRGSTVTTLYDLDIRNQNSAPFGILASQNPPNNGTLNSIDSVRLESNGSFFGIPPTSTISIDIYSTGTFNKGYLVEVSAPSTSPSTSGLSRSNLYDLSLPASSASPNNPANTFPPGSATNKRTLVDLSASRPLNIIDFAVAPRATIISLVPKSVEAGTPGLTLTVNGTGFANGATVQFRGSDRPTTFVSVQQLTVALTAADLATVGAYNVTVTNPPFPGVPSEPAVFTVTEPCAAPTALTTSNVSGTTATVSFRGNGSATSYTVTTSPATTTQTLPATATSVSFAGLTPGTTYTVRITTTCPSGTTGPATIAFTTTVATATLAVRQGSTSYPNGGTAYNFGNQTLNTTSPAVAFTLTNGGADPLTIASITTTGDYAVSGTAPTTLPGGGTATVSVAFTPTAIGPRPGTLLISSTATNGTTYTVNLTGNGEPRMLATVPAALARLASVYPNPARGTATLLLPAALRGKAATAVSVVDNLGRTVLTRTLAAGTAEKLELPLGGLAAGVYSVQARTAVGLVVKRLVVQ